MQSSHPEALGSEAHPALTRERAIAPPATADEPRSDAEICEDVAARIAVPRAAEADSFVLHAPLELLARTALLPLVSPSVRPAARRRLLWLGETYDAWGAGLATDTATPRRPAEEPASDLVAAIDRGDLDAADAAAAHLAATRTAEELARALADDVIPRLGAAGHGPIFLHQLPRVAPRSSGHASGLRGLVRELAREPDWRLTWHRDRSAGPRSDDLVERLLRPPSPGTAVSPFIYPTMSLVESSGLAKQVLDAPTRRLDPALASRLLARVAAWSMLQDDPEHAPYGWTHCLSMPQAVLGLAGWCRDPQAAVAVAATYVLGFRATLGKVALDPGWQPEPPSTPDCLESLAGSPSEAAAGVWRAPHQHLSTLTRALADRAAVHPDAHLAKYTVACFDAARADPAARRLYLAAAAYLSAWWGRRDSAG